MADKLYFVTTEETSSRSDEQYWQVVATALNKAVKAYNVNGVNAFEVSPSRAAELLGQSLDVTPSVFVQVEGMTKVYLLQGRKSATELDGFFTTVFVGDVTKDKNGGDSSNGGHGNSGLPMRPCIPILDDTVNALLGFMGLDAQKIAEYKQYVFFGAAGVCGFMAFNSVKKVGQIGYGTAAAALAALGAMPIDPAKKC